MIDWCECDCVEVQCLMRLRAATPWLAVPLSREGGLYGFQGGLGTVARGAL